jgi:hypothetical protein
MNEERKFNFQPFYSRYIRKIGEVVTLSKEGRLYFSLSLCRRLNLCQYSFVTPYYDEINKAVGFKFSQEKEPNANKITPQNAKQKEYGVVVMLSSFVNHYRIIDDVNNVGKYLLKEYKTENNEIIYYFILGEKIIL